MESWIDLVVMMVMAFNALVGLQTALINRKIALHKAEEAEKEKAAPADTGDDR